jgi:uncharacterized membrane protein
MGSKIILNYFFFLIIYLLIDMIWLYGARPLHIHMVESVQKEPLKANFKAAALFYLIAPIAYIGIIEPHSHSLKEALQLSLTVSGLMYGTFDLTNKTIFKNYSWSYTFTDIWWGMFSMTMTTFIMFRLKSAKMGL